MSLSTSEDFELDLDAARTGRREGGKKVPSLRISGTRYELPVELPVDVLAPLTEVNMDVSLLIRQVLDARNEAVENGAAANEAILDAVVNMLIANPNLPTELVDAVKTMASRLLGDEGYAALVAYRPTVGDLGAIAKHLGRQYGVGLGEASPSSDSSEGTGTTSNPTSPASTPATTSGRSGKPRARRAS